MAEVKTNVKEIVADAVNAFIKEKGLEVSQISFDSLQVVTPPNPEMGDLGVPLFVFSKLF